LAKLGDQVRARLAEEGWRGVTRRTALRLISPLFHSTTVARFEIPVHTIRERQSPPGIDFSDLRPDEIPELARFSPHVLPREIARRLAAGFACHIARSEGRIVFCGWLGWGEIPASFIGETLRLPPGWGCSYNVFTAPAHRGRGLFQRYANRLAAACEDRGIHHLLSFVDLANGIPLRAYVKVTGATRMSLIHHRRIVCLWTSTRREEVEFKRSRRDAPPASP
jgi:GNAT superfamily N-acetyltransferase